MTKGVAPCVSYILRNRSCAHTQTQPAEPVMTAHLAQALRIHVFIAVLSVGSTATTMTTSQPLHAQQRHDERKAATQQHDDDWPKNSQPQPLHAQPRRRRTNSSNTTTRRRRRLTETQPTPQPVHAQQRRRRNKRQQHSNTATRRRRGLTEENSRNSNYS